MHRDKEGMAGCLNCHVLVFAKDSRLPFLAVDRRLHWSACSHTCKSVPVLRHRSWEAMNHWRLGPGSRFTEAHFIRKCCFMLRWKYDSSYLLWKAIMRSSHNSRMFNGFSRWWQPERAFVTIIQTHFFTLPNIWWRWSVEPAMQMRPLSLVWLFWSGFSFLLTGEARVVPDLSGSMAVHILKRVFSKSAMNYTARQVRLKTEDKRVCTVLSLCSKQVNAGSATLLTMTAVYWFLTHQYDVHGAPNQPPHTVGLVQELLPVWKIHARAHTKEWIEAW